MINMLPSFPFHLLLNAVRELANRPMSLFLSVGRLRVWKRQLNKEYKGEDKLAELTNVEHIQLKDKNFEVIFF